MSSFVGESAICSCNSTHFREDSGKKICIYCRKVYIPKSVAEADEEREKAKARVKGAFEGVVDSGKIIITKVEEIKRSRQLALVLSLFLGFVGAHHFYLGYYKRGVISIIMSATVIGLIISFPSSIIDVFRIAIGSYKPKNGEYE